ncbi:universal stress protein (plasmid) [Pseudorhodobacter turbinis]|uniref:Universal stress protein n=1 Tax=Pseudorhodobacter turbinis TaxID=2500533 RepID=A0A4V1E1D7_9RHOB|nr:universal stress protein [Pseudorhodobacter turbinis]QCO57774.1 universal stress protein [Pseudorhodobacter turbinis]
MKNSTILIATSKDAPLDRLAQKLETLRAIPARAVVLLVAQMPVFPYSAIGLPPFGPIDIPPEWQEEVANLRTSLNDRAQEVEALLQAHDISGEVATATCEPAMLADAIARRAMLCDMAIISEELREPEAIFRQAVYGVLFQSPAGLLLNDPKAAVLSAPKRVFVAWNTHLHSARAVHQALPLLRQADEVVIASFDPVMTELREGEEPGADVAKWLTHHGCTVTVQQYPSGGKDIAECILDRSKEVGADLIVMGAYGHSRMRETIFGGTTHSMIAQSDRAVFLGR